MKKIFFALSITPLLFMSFAIPVLAQTPPGGGGNPGEGGGNTPSVPVSFRIENPFDTGDNLFQLMESILKNIIIPIGGILCVLGFIWAGFQFVVAQGNPSKLTDARRTLTYTAIGTAILLGATTIQLLLKSTLNEVLK